MVTDQQVKKLFRLLQRGESLTMASARAGMDTTTGRRYARARKLPTQMKREHTWRTREDVFEDVWDEVRSKLEVNAGLQAKTLFEDLQRRYPGRFADGQLRSLQRKVKHWRATEGPSKEVYFEQVYVPGERSQSDFTYMKKLGVTIRREPFDHLIYHFVLPYSNWETGTICYSESFEALSEGLQNALWELGGVPRMHQTDRLSTAVHGEFRSPGHTRREIFTRRYEALLGHYGIEPLRTQASSPHENGDVEQRHYRFKSAVDQQLMLRGSRDFDSLDAYRAFLQQLLHQLNAGRQKRLAEERRLLGALPPRRIEACRPPIVAKVTRFSTIRVLGNVYSVDSRLRDERVKVKLFVEEIEVWYAQRCIHRIPRLRGKNRHRIDYRDVIDWLVRKPGAFARYRYREELFPTHRFRVAYDALRLERPLRAEKDYLRILHVAARENETAVDDALRYLIGEELAITPEAVSELVRSATRLPAPHDVCVDAVDLKTYDLLLANCGDGAAGGELPSANLHLP